VFERFCRAAYSQIRVKGKPKGYDRLIELSIVLDKSLIYVRKPSNVFLASAVIRRRKVNEILLAIKQAVDNESDKI